MGRAGGWITMPSMAGEQPERSGSIYSFGETELAAERLRAVSEVFDPSSEAFVSGTVQSRPRLALDLGCGPGFTTRLLSRATGAKRTVGVDRSEAFLSRARATSTGEEYVVADVAASGRIAGIDRRPDLIYARFLASHLPQPERTISGWAGELEAGGRLLLEDVESISTVVAAFDHYLKIVAGMLARHGNELFVGPRLAAHQWDDNVEVNRTAEVRPRTGQVARMFSMNLLSWRHDPYVGATYSQEEVARLATELDELAGSSETEQIVWRLCQISVRRSPT